MNGVCRIVFWFSEHVPLLLLYSLVEVNCSGYVVDAVETVPKMTEHFATCRFARRCEVVDGDVRADKRSHLARAHGHRVRNVSDMYTRRIKPVLHHAQA